MPKTSLILPSLAVACGLLLTGAASAQAQVKVGIVDMNKVFAGYYKTKDAESKINEAREVAKKELDDRMDSHKTMLTEINDLNKKIDTGGALSATAKADLGKKRDDKIAQVRDLEREIQEFKGSREKQLQEQAVRMRNQIVEEIMKLVNDKVKSDNYDLVFDKSGQSLNGVQIVLYSADKMEFSDDIITSLNKTRPSGAAATSGNAAPAAPAAPPKR